MQSVGEISARFTKFAPHFKGPVTPKETVTGMLSLIKRASLADGFGGAKEGGGDHGVLHFDGVGWL